MFLENTANLSEQFGSIEVICGSMFSGKTEELIRRINRCRISKLKVIALKPSVDNRYGKNIIISHNKKSVKAVEVESSGEIINLAKEFDVVAIDEAQFFDKKIVSVCNKLANEGLRVIVAGLDMDSNGSPFGSMPNLMAVAEFVTKLHAICSKSGNIAQFTFRKVENDNLIAVGEKEKYEALSRKVFYNLMKEKN
tara:strand:- start:21567 stop:22151 length:585 start_codon:yes stop_codon:yes gene_type:complete